MKVHIVNEDQLTRPTISKKAMNRIVENKDKQYKDMRAHFEHRLHEKNLEVGLHIHNEKNFERLLKEKDRFTYYVGGITFLIGGVIGWLIA